MPKTSTPADGLETLERMAVASVALTARALAEVAPELTFVQWRVLVIVDAPDGVPVGQLAVSLGAKIAAMSRLVRRLQARGLLETRRDEHDARIVRVTITAAGRELRERVLERRQAALARALVDVPVPASAWDSLADVATALEDVAASRGDLHG